MSEQNTELLSSYQRIKKQLDQQSQENKILTDKVNSLVVLLEAEKETRAKVERGALIEKINAINKDFKASDDMDATALKWILKGMESLSTPKQNSKEPSGSQEEINPIPDTPKLNGQPIPEDMKQFIAKREDTSILTKLTGRTVE